MANEIKHIGTPRHSGRYPWGSGDDPYQHGGDFLSTIDQLRKSGMSETDIAKSQGMSTSELRARRTIELNKKKAADAAMAYRLKQKGYSNVGIAKRMGISDHTVAALLDPALKQRAEVTEITAGVLKDNVAKRGFIDIGSGVEVHLGISRTKLDVAIAMLKEEGYTVHTFPQEQMGTGKYTWMKVLAPPGTTLQEVSRNREKVKTFGDYSEDGGSTFKPIRPPVSIDGQRVFIRYKEDGGQDKDGVIELRRNVDDIDLGGVHYSQVRIGVDGTHFMKGMAMYGDDIPDGFDIVYNTNKPRGTPKDKVLKPMETDDPEYPFGSVVRQKTYKDKDGNEKQSVLNIVGVKEGSGEEGYWNTWSKNLSSQVLSKQSPALAKKQLGLAFNLKKEEFDEIMSLTNPAVKQALLGPFADACDSDAVHLKAAALPRQSSKVLLPLNSLKPNEAYAPSYLDGDVVVLIRHPHGGIFEIPQLVVNNKNPEGKRNLGDSQDMIAVHTSVAKKLSGADFDGDTVIVIPNQNKNIAIAPSLKALKNFEPKEAYPYYDGMKVMDKRTKALKMGDVSNLITDMTIKGASDDEIARAVRHSMVVIDAMKHKLNYKQSEIDNNIPELKKKYQGSERAGAATLISKSGAEVRVDEIQERRPLKGETITGKKLYKETGRTFIKRKFVTDPITGQKTYLDEGAVVLKRKTKTTQMARTEDAFSLSSGTPIETVYARHANALKELAKTARISLSKVENVVYSPSARKIYDQEVSALKSKLKIAYRNKPLERQAQLIASRVVLAKKRANPHLDEDDIKKIKGQELINARNRVGARKEKIIITDKEWEAIQAGAVSHNVLLNILSNSDLDGLKQRAMPRHTNNMSTARRNRATQMIATGYTHAEVANALGVSLSVLEKSLE